MNDPSSSSIPVQQQASRRRLGRLAAVSYRRRRRMVAAWVLATIAVFGLSGALAGDYSADYAAHGSDSDQAQELLEASFPAQAGQEIDVVVRAEGGVTDPAVQADVTGMLDEVRTVPHVIGIVSPFGPEGTVSPDGRTALGSIQTDIGPSETGSIEDAKQILAFADAAQRDGLRIELGGGPISAAEAGALSSEVVGIIAAAIILLVTFGTVVAAGLPILVALLGLAIGAALIGLLTTVVDTPEWAPQLAAMMALGIGIDYVLLMLTRYREFLSHGLDPESAVVCTVESAGRAVLVAGSTVVISMLGLFATDLNYMQGASLATILSVLVIMLAAVTLLPALLGFAGTNVDRLRLPGARHRTAGGSPMWTRWSRTVQRRPWPAAAVAVVVLVLLAVPFLDMRFGFPDAGNETEDKSSRQAYDLITEGFGPGANGPLLVVGDLAQPGDTGSLDRLTDRLVATPGVAQVLPAQLNPAGDAALVTVIPTTSPQDTATEDLVRTVRDDVVPGAVSGTSDRIHVGGLTAMGIDTTEDIASTLPLLVGGVVGLSFLLLLTVFRSVAVAVKAAVMNILSIGAAYGVVAYVLQGNWAGQLIGIDVETPLPAFIPVLMFAILFGLSMDYEVFLISRIREYWLHTGDNSKSVTMGLAATARVITAAAAIMVAVFSAFVLSPDVFLKALGIGLATAILVDATIIRMLLVPAVMQLLGRANWWLPGWLDRTLPQLHVEAPVEPEDLPEIPAQAVPAHDEVREPTA